MFPLSHLYHKYNSKKSTRDCGSANIESTMQLKKLIEKVYSTNQAHLHTRPPCQPGHHWGCSENSRAWRRGTCWWRGRPGRRWRRPGWCSQWPGPPRLRHQPRRCFPAKEVTSWWHVIICDEMMFTWEPPLKARNPKIRINPPRPARGTECPSMSWAWSVQ